MKFENGTTATQTITGTITFYDLTLANSGATINFGTSNVTIVHTLYTTAGTMDPGTGTITFSGSNSALTGSTAKRFYDLVVASGATLSHSSGGYLHIQHNLTNDGSFVQAATQKTYFENTSSTHALSGSGSSTFGSIQVYSSTTLNAGAHDFTISGSSFRVTGIFNGDAATVTFDRTTTLDGSGAYNFNNIIIGNTGSLTSTSGNINVAGDWTNNGAFAHNSGTVTFNGSGTQTIGGATITAFNNLTIVSGATVIVPAANEPTVAGTVANNGVLQQTQTVSGLAEFLKIGDGAGGNTYYGIDLNGSLGSVTVTVAGNQSADACSPTGSYPVRRCYSITASTAATAATTFYYEYGELRVADGQDPSTLYVWKDNGDGTWTRFTPDSRSACSGGIQCSVTVNSLSLSQGSNDFVLANYDPQAVTLDFFLAEVLPGKGVHITWQTVSELNIMGFNLYRAQNREGPWTRLNSSLIVCFTPGSTQEHLYEWWDARTVSAPDLFYRLEIRDLKGLVMQWVETAVHASSYAEERPYPVWLPWISQDR